MNNRAFRAYRGTTDTEKAMNYLLATRPGFSSLTRYEQIRMAGDVVKGGTGDALTKERLQEAGASPGSKVDALRGHLDSEGFGKMLEDALSEDADGTGKIFDSVVARVTSKRTPAGGGPGPSVVAASSVLAAYPGRNEIEQAQAYLAEKVPGFKFHDRQKQVRLASQYTRDLARAGQAEADRVLMSSLGAA